MKRAVVVVHGMGQQVPGRLQRSLGEALCADGDEWYVAPDRISGRTDTHRVTIRHADGDETHVYEHYWSDRFQDTKLRHVLPWVFRLLTHGNLGFRLGTRSFALEWIIGLVAALPSLLLIVAPAIWERADVAALLEDVPTIAVIVGLAMVTAVAVRTLLRSTVAAAVAGIVVGGLWALVEWPTPSIGLAISAIVLLWPPGWLLVGAGMRKVGPIPLIRTTLVVGVLVPFSLTLLSPGLVTGGIPAVLTALLLGFWMKHWIGDVARYLDRTAANAEEADRLRRDAATFLEAVATDARYGYEEVILVAHSQGGFVAYDALAWVWQQWAAEHEIDFEERVATDDIDRIAADEDATPVEWGAAVDELQDALRQRQRPWRIAHFVTLGSPIGHAADLLTDGADALERQAELRAISTCPPHLHGEPGSVAYRSPDGRRFHHSSVFAATKWSNVVYESDLLGGPVTDEGLGRLVRNVILGEDDERFSPTLLDFAMRFPHDAYWHAPRPVFEPFVDETRTLLRHIIRGE